MGHLISLIPMLDVYVSRSCFQIKGHHYLLPAICHSAPSTHNTFSLEQAAIDQAGLSDWFIMEFFFFAMSTFEDELRREGLLVDLDALPMQAVSGGTTGGWMMDQDNWQVRKKTFFHCISLRLPKPQGLSFVFIVSERELLLASSSTARQIMERRWP